MTSLRGTVIVSSPGAPPVRATTPGGGRVLVAPGVQGPPGHGVNLAGAVPTYADLPVLTLSDAGKAFMVQDDGKLYVWSGVSWPADGAGAQFRGETGPEGRGIRVVSVDGNDLLLGMTDGSTVRASVPALAAAVAARDVAVAARADAVSARVVAELARDGAVDAADRAEGAAGGVAADAAAAGDAAGRAEVAAGDAASSAEAAGVSAGEAAASAEAVAVDAAAVGDAREYVSGLHADLSPGGYIMTGFEWVEQTTSDHALEALAARDAAQGHADRAESAAAGVDQVVSDAAGVVAAELADDVAAAQAARTGAETARDDAWAAAAGVGQAMADAAGTLRVEVADDMAAAQSARTGAESARDQAVGAVASIAAHATAAEDARDGAEAALDAASGVLATKADLVGGVVPSSQIPAVAMTRPHVVADVAGLLALDVQEGDVGIIPDGPDAGSYMLGTGPSTEIGSWKRLVTPEAPVSSVNGQTGTITLGAGDVGAATAGDVAAVTGRVSALESSRPTLAEVQARPAMWLWDGSGQWSPPTGAVDTDTVLNTATGEIYSIQEVA